MLRIRQLELHLTHRCTLRCSYCYAAALNGQLPADMPAEIALRAVDFLFEHCADEPRLRLELYGGEPLLRMDLIEQVCLRARSAAARREGRLSIGLPTNGTLLDRRARRALAQLGVDVSLSLDGGPAANLERRAADGSDGWTLIGPRVEEIAAETELPRPPVRMTISPSRAAYFFEDIGYLLERGFRQIAFAPASGVFWDDEATRLLDEQLALVADDFVSWIREGRPRPPYFTTVLRRLAYLWVEARHGAAPLRNATCGAGRSVLAVAPNGELYPCHRAAALVPLRDELKMGDIFRGVINADLALRLSLLGPDEAGLRCRDCARRRHCGRFCPVQNFCEAGDVAMVPDSACHANLRLQKVADRISTALADEPCYRSYIEPFQTSDPDERHLPLLAELERDPAAIADKAARLLEAMGKMEDE